MKTDKNGTKSRTSQRQSDVDFVNFNLSDQQRAELKKSSFDVDSALLRLTEEDYKVTISYDSYNACYSCFLVPKTPDHLNAGMILSGRGSTPVKAIKQAAYIHWNCFDGNWSSGRIARREEIDD